MSVLDQLKDMGFNPIVSEAAIKYLKTEDIGALADWISQHTQEEQNESKWSKWLQDQKQGKGNNQGAQGQGISHLVKKQLVDQLMKKGHSKNVAQKSLLLTGNTTIESAQKWIQQHRYDSDFGQQLLLQGSAFQESTLTDEQARQKLKQLTQKARQIRKKRQQQQQREREKNRVKYGKQMIEAKRIAEQQAIKRNLELDKIQKQRDEQYKQKLVEQMRRERQQKLGKKLQGGQQTSNVGKQNLAKPQKSLSKLEQVEVQCQQVAVGMHAYPDRAKVFFETANIYVGNIIKNNGDEKTRKINKQNRAFQERILSCFGGVQTLEVIGFKEEDGFLWLRQYDLGELGKISEILKRYASQY